MQKAALLFGFPIIFLAFACVYLFDDTGETTGCDFAITEVSVIAKSFGQKKGYFGVIAKNKTRDRYEIVPEEGCACIQPAKYYGPQVINSNGEKKFSFSIDLSGIVSEESKIITFDIINLRTTEKLFKNAKVIIRPEIKISLSKPYVFFGMDDDGIKTVVVSLFANGIVVKPEENRKNIQVITVDAPEWMSAEVKANTIEFKKKPSDITTPLLYAFAKIEVSINGVSESVKLPTGIFKNKSKMQ